jgi:hypothetical protein
MFTSFKTVAVGQSLQSSCICRFGVLRPTAAADPSVKLEWNTSKSEDVSNGLRGSHSLERTFSSIKAVVFHAMHLPYQFPMRP